jgi:hypothetical protein
MDLYMLRAQLTAAVITSKQGHISNPQSTTLAVYVIKSTVHLVH